MTPHLDPPVPHLQSGQVYERRKQRRTLNKRYPFHARVFRRCTLSPLSIAVCVNRGIAAQNKGELHRRGWKGQTNNRATWLSCKSKQDDVCKRGHDG